MTTVHWIQLMLILVIAAGAVFWFRALRKRPHDPAVRALFLVHPDTGSAMAIGFLTGSWAACHVLGETPGLPQLIASAATMALAYHVTLILARADNTAQDIEKSKRQKRRWLIIALSFLLMCYTVGSFGAGQAFLPFDGRGIASIVTYVAVIQIYLGMTLDDNLRLCWTNRNIGPCHFGVGLRPFAVGAGFAILFSLHKLVYLAITAFGIALPWDESGTAGIQLTFLAPALILTSAALTVPQLWPRIVRLRKLRATYNRLIPLVIALNGVNRSGIFNHQLQLRSFNGRLLYQVITIRDSLLGPLQSQLDMAVYQIAYARGRESGFDSEDSRAIAEAACIRAALSGHCSSISEPLSPQTFTYHADLESEAAWLARVSDAFATSTLIPEILHGSASEA